jgi:hypothetical protein
VCLKRGVDEELDQAVAGWRDREGEAGSFRPNTKNVLELFTRRKRKRIEGKERDGGGIRARHKGAARNDILNIGMVIRTQWASSSQNPSHRTL